MSKILGLLCSEWGWACPEHFCEIIFNLGSGGPFVQQSGTICAILVEHHEEHFCEIILNLDQWFKRCRFEIFLILSSGHPFVRWSGFICIILVAGLMRNNSV